MTQTFTKAAEFKARQLNKQPQLVLEIEGFDTLFGVSTIKEYLRIGDPGLYIDGTWRIGIPRELEDQFDYIKLDKSSTSIKQQLQPDKGAVSSVSSMTISLIDKNLEISKLISPGVVVDEIMGRRATVYMGFDGTGYPDDYFRIFEGVIADIVSGPGLVDLTINHPDEKKRQELFTKLETKLAAPAGSGDTTLTLDTTAGLLEPSAGGELRTFVRIQDEFIEYAGIAGNTITGCTRGSLASAGGAAAAAYSTGEDVSSFYILEDAAIPLALKLMLSGVNGPYAEDIEIANIEQISPSIFVENAISFPGVKVAEKYGLTVGDLVTIQGSAFGANNVTEKPIEQIFELEFVTYLVIGGVTFTTEADSPATVSFRSQYDVLGHGLKMTPQQVDVARHQDLYEKFLASVNMRFYVEEAVNGKDFIEGEIYSPIAAYSVPRKARSSIGLHIAPLPTADIVTLNRDNIVNPKGLKLRRSMGKNFYNSIVYKFDKKLLEDKFSKGTVTTNETSVSEIKKRQTFTVESRGLRSDLQAVSIASTASTRRLNRYKRGAEFIENVEIFFGVGSRVEVGDVVILDPTDLEMTDTKTGTRDKPAKFWEIINKTIEISGKVSVSLTDTSFDGSARYALIGPASYVKTTGTTTQAEVKPSFSQKYGVDEWRKWEKFIGCGLRVRSADSVTRFGETFLSNIIGNVLIFDPDFPLSFAPQADDIIEFSPYNNQTTNVKLVHGFMSDGTSDFDDGEQPYVMI